MSYRFCLVLCFVAAGGAALDDADEAQPRENLLHLVSLSEHPLARCNDGTPAVYYRRPLSSPRDTRKLLLYLEGGGLCVPGDPAVSCAERCANGSLLCTAHTAPYFDLDTYYEDSIFSPDPEQNPAFHDYNIGEGSTCDMWTIKLPQWPFDAI